MIKVMTHTYENCSNSRTDKHKFMPASEQLPCNSHTKTPRGRPKRTKEEITQKIYIYIYQ